MSYFSTIWGFILFVNILHFKYVNWQINSALFLLLEKQYSYLLIKIRQQIFRGVRQCREANEYKLFLDEFSITSLYVLNTNNGKLETHTSTCTETCIEWGNSKVVTWEGGWTHRKFFEGIESLQTKNKGIILLKNFNQLEHWQSTLFQFFQKTWTY